MSCCGVRLSRQQSKDIIEELSCYTHLEGVYAALFFHSVLKICVKGQHCQFDKGRVYMIKLYMGKGKGLKTGGKVRNLGLYIKMELYSAAYTCL